MSSRSRDALHALEACRHLTQMRTGPAPVQACALPTPCVEWTRALAVLIGKRRASRLGSGARKRTKTRCA